MNSDVVCGGSVAVVFDVNGFHDDPLPVVVAVFLGWAPSPSLLFVLGAGFDDGENTCFVFDHIAEGAEPTLLNIDGCAGAADGG
jgi:hypothetical protein